MILRRTRPPVSRPRPKSRPIIAVGAADPVFRGKGQWMDGTAPRVLPAGLTFDDAAATLVVTPSGAAASVMPFGALRRLPDQARTTGAVLIGPEDVRLIVGPEDLMLIRTRAPGLDRRLPGPRRWSAALRAIAAAGVVVAVIGWAAPALYDGVAGLLAPETAAALRSTPYGSARALLPASGQMPR